MTREEVIERIKVLKARCERLALNSSRGFSEWKMDAEACEIAISALTPLTQEQMKSVTAIGEYGDSVNSYMPGYCPLCGRPLTPEAWEETRKRMDVLKCE